jgi:hypothetical protein
MSNNGDYITIKDRVAAEKFVLSIVDIVNAEAEKYGLIVAEIRLKPIPGGEVDASEDEAE